MKKKNYKTIDSIVMENMIRNNLLYNDPGIVINGFQFRSLKSSSRIGRNPNFKRSLSNLNSKNDNSKINPSSKISQNNSSIIKEPRIIDKFPPQKSILNSLIERKILNEKYSFRNMLKYVNEIPSCLKSINGYQKPTLIQENESRKLLKPLFYINTVRMNSCFKKNIDYNSLNNLGQFDIKSKKRNTDSLFRIIQHYKTIKTKKLVVNDIKIPLLPDNILVKRKSDLIEKKVDFAKAHRNSKIDFFRKINNYSDHNIHVFANREMKKN